MFNHSQANGMYTTKTKKQPIQTKQKVFQKIENEYSEKRCNFNPISPSPNRFIKNLEVRMRMYYKELYKSYK